MKLPRPSLPKTLKGRIALIFALLLLTGAGIGGAWAWKNHQIYVASPEYAVGQLNQAISEKNADAFAKIADSHALAGDIIQALTALESPLPTPDNKPVVPSREKIQEFFLAVLKGEKLPPLALFKMPALPPDLYDQLVQHPFVITKVDSTHGLVMVESILTHPKDTPFPVRLFLTREKGAWRVGGMVNAKELAERYRQTLLAELERQHQAKLQTLADHKQAMSRLLPDLTCTATVTIVSGNSPLLILSLDSGTNPGPETVKAWGTILTLAPASGEVAAAPRIESTEAIQPGSKVHSTWPHDLTEQEFKRLQALGPLICTAEREYAILDNNKILKGYLDEK